MQTKFFRLAGSTSQCSQTTGWHRRGVVAVVWVGLLAVASFSMQAEPVQLRPAEFIQAGGATLDLGDHAVPCVADWNGDGRKDLLVGYRITDKIAVFCNVGTDAQPAFTNFANVRAGGVDIYHAGSSCGGPAPWVCDYDADGRRDLLVGTGAEGQVWFYQNTNTDAAPLLAPGIQLLAGGVTLSVGYRATPCVHDWDEDGLADLLCGRGDGTVSFFRNTGSAQSPAYVAGTLIQAAGLAVNFNIRSAVRVVDWDGDGRKDLVGSGSAYAGWCRNLGSNASPTLAALQALVVPDSGGGLSPVNTGYRMRLEVVDWNNDGVGDLLIGQHDGRVSCFEGYHLAFDHIMLSPNLGCVLRWQSAAYLRYNVLAGESPDAVTNLIASNVASQGNSTSWTNEVQTDQRFFRVQTAP